MKEYFYKFNNFFFTKHLQNLASEDNYAEIIRDKTIALVGPASYLENSKWGKEIDSYDLVIRINRGIELIDNYSSDIGLRTDILYSCLIEDPENAGIIDPILFSEKYNLKFICTTPFSNLKSFFNKNDIHPMADKDKFKTLSKLIPSRIISHRYWESFSKELETRPTTGYISIFDILKFRPKKIKIFGFSFYSTGILKGYKKGTKYKEETFHDVALRSKRHNHRKMFDYAKNILLNDARVELDPFLQNLFKKKILNENNNL